MCTNWRPNEIKLFFKFEVYYQTFSGINKVSSSDNHRLLILGNCTSQPTKQSSNVPTVCASCKASLTSWGKMITMNEIRTQMLGHKFCPIYDITKHMLLPTIHCWWSAVSKAPLSYPISTFPNLQEQHNTSNQTH